MSKRRYLTGKEVQAMMQAVCYGATGARDYCLILLAYRHGMRISELLDLHYQDLDLNEGRINIRRLKNGFSTVHPLRFDEREAVERWTQERAKEGANKQVISSQADSLIKISRIWADFFPANTSNQPI
ncbi:hypothetical protein EA186_25060 [Escherichia coli]|nr:hypothetical protein EA186_25060 [Escherichia coli]